MNMMRMECQGSNTIGIALFPITLSFGGNVVVVVVIIIIILTASSPHFLLFCIRTNLNPLRTMTVGCVCVSPLFVCLNDKFTIYYWFRCHKNSKLHFHLLFLLCLRSVCLIVVALHSVAFPSLEISSFKHRMAMHMQRRYFGNVYNSIL